MMHCYNVWEYNNRVAVVVIVGVALLCFCVVAGMYRHCCLGKAGSSIINYATILMYNNNYKLWTSYTHQVISSSKF